MRHVKAPRRPIIVFRLHVIFFQCTPSSNNPLNWNYYIVTTVTTVHATFLWKGLEMATCLPNLKAIALQEPALQLFIQHRHVSPAEHQPIANCLIWTSHDGLHDPKMLKQQVSTNSDQGNIYHLRKHAIQIYQEKWQTKRTWVHARPNSTQSGKLTKKHNFGSVKCDPGREATSVVSPTTTTKDQ